MIAITWIPTGTHVWNLKVRRRSGRLPLVSSRRNSRLSSSDLGVVPILVALAAFSLAVLAYFN